MPDLTDDEKRDIARCLRIGRTHYRTDSGELREMALLTDEQLLEANEFGEDG